jgi:(S)-mandelate dehydrogenase
MAGGEEGAKHALEILRTELERSMKLCGVRSVADIDADILAPH